MLQISNMHPIFQTMDPSASSSKIKKSNKPLLMTAIRTTTIYQFRACNNRPIVIFHIRDSQCVLISLLAICTFIECTYIFALSQVLIGSISNKDKQFAPRSDLFAIRHCVLEIVVDKLQLPDRLTRDKFCHISTRSSEPCAPSLGKYRSIQTKQNINIT